MTNVDRLRDSEWPRHNADMLAQPWATETIHGCFADAERALQAVIVNLNVGDYNLNVGDYGPYDAALRPRLERIHTRAGELYPDVAAAHKDDTTRHARMPRWGRLLRRLHDGS